VDRGKSSICQSFLSKVVPRVTASGCRLAWGICRNPSQSQRARVNFQAQASVNRSPEDASQKRRAEKNNYLCYPPYNKTQETKNHEH